jgi:PKD domain
MARRLLIGILLLGTLSLLAFAQEVPTVIQPQQAGYSPAQLSTLEGAINQLQAKLKSANLGSKKKLGVGGWTAEKFAAYTAGNLERLGYQVAIVSSQMQDGTTKIWVVVRVDLGGAIAWIPVEPLVNPNIYQPDLGDVPLVGTLIYGSDYLSYTSFIELPPNVAPTAVIRSPMSDIVETAQNAWFGNSSVDPDGEIVLYQWTFGEDVQRVTHTISAWYSFPVGGREFQVSLTVTDNRGAQSTASTTVYVLTGQEHSDKSCGCG